MQQPTESKHKCCEQDSFTRRAVRQAAKQWKQWQRLITLRHTVMQKHHTQYTYACPVNPLPTPQ